MKFSRMVVALCLLATTAFTTSYSAEVRVCNKGNVELNNLDFNSWKIRKLDVGECTDYFKNPMAQEYVPVSINIDGKSLGFRPKKTSYLLGEGKFSYQVSVADDKLLLQTVKD